MRGERRDREAGSRGRAGGARHGKRSLYLMESKLVSGRMATLDRGGETKDA
jgi:hypothetical protein